MLQIISQPEEVRAYFMEAAQYLVANMAEQAPVVKPDIVTTEVLCERLTLTPQTLLKWRKKGKIPYMSLGANIRYDFNKVLEALEAKKKGVLK